MIDNDVLVMIPKSELEGLEESKAHLEMLEAMGVDNWEGYVPPGRECVGCGEYYSWNEDECQECYVDLPKPHDMI